MKRHLIWTVGLALVAAACGDATAPEPTDGTYVLTSLNGAPLPYDHEGLGCCTYLSGTLTLEHPHYEMRITARNRNTGEVFTAGEHGTCTHEQMGLRFMREGHMVQPMGLTTATMSGDRIELAFGGEGPGSPDQFHAVFRRGD